MSKRKLQLWITIPALVLLTAGGRQTRDVTAQTPQANQVRIVLTAVDKDLQFVTTLRPEDLRITQDGAPQKIVSFQQVTDQAVSLVILIDTSASQERTLPDEKLAAASFVDSIVRPGMDRAAVATFTGTLKVEQKLTNDVTLLQEAIARAKFVPPPGYVRSGLVIGPPPPPKRTPAALAGQTAIWDAVLTACNELFSSSNGQTRSAIILLTDGEDTVSKSKISDAVELAVRVDVPIYSIGIGDSGEYGIDKDALRKLSERTGGRAFFPKKNAELSPILNEIGRELRNQYIIEYLSTKFSRSAAKIRIEIVNPSLKDVRLSYQRIAVPKKP